MTEAYNGWTNYETYEVGSMIANDEGLYLMAQSIVTQHVHPGAALREYVEEIAGSYDWDLGPVNWSEIFDMVREEEDPA